MKNAPALIGLLNASELILTVEEGRSYFVWQEVKMGLFAVRSKLQLFDEVKGKAGVSECRLTGTK